MSLKTTEAKPSKTEPPTGKGTGAYDKGNTRRDTLLNGASDLLADHGLDELSLKDIAEYVSIPVGSAYHFFTNSLDLYTVLAQRFRQDLQTEIAAPYSARQVQSWQRLFDSMVDRAAALYASNPAYRQLVIGPKAPPEIKLADPANDERVGQLIIDVFSRYFELPSTKRLADAFFYTSEIVDLMFTLSTMRNGEITTHMLVEAKKAGKAYLRLYLPEDLPRSWAGRENRTRSDGQ